MEETTSVITVTLVLAALGLKVDDFVKSASNLLFPKETRDTLGTIVCTTDNNRARP